MSADHQTTVTIIVPSGYASAEEFCTDCGFQQVHSNATRWSLHRWAARYVFWRWGFTHWCSGPGNYVDDPNCPLCRLQRLLWRSA